MYFAHSEETARKVGRMPLTDFISRLSTRRHLNAALCSGWRRTDSVGDQSPERSASS